MSRQPRQLVALGDTRERGDCRRRQRAGAAHIDVEAVIGCRDLNVERLVDRLQHVGQRACCIECTIQRWIEDRAGIDREDGVAVRGREADGHRATRIASRMDDEAAASRAVGIDQVIDTARDAGAR